MELVPVTLNEFLEGLYVLFFLGVILYAFVTLYVDLDTK